MTEDRSGQREKAVYLLTMVVKSWTIGIINRAVQLLIITYFIG
uniref:Uncharacterized protein n=1 Tax=Cyclopterus lumpus TaxID=8103 RepID=A0A8C3A7A7_CYCLU